AEREVTRRWRDTVLPKLGHPAAGAAPLGERMYAYLTKNPGGRGRNHTVISEEELGRIKRVLDDIRRKRLPGAPAPPGTLSLALEEAVELGLEKNLRLQITRLNEDALETEIARARAIFHPLVGGSFTASRKKEAGKEKLNDDRIILNGRRISDTSIRTPTVSVTENIPTGARIPVEIVRAQDTETLARAEGNRQLSQNALSDVLGVPIGTETQLRHEAIDFQPIPSDLETWIALANERRPEIMAADEALKKSWLNVRVAQNGLLPNVDLTAAYGRAQTGTSVGRALDFRGDEWTAGLLFSYPL